MKKALSIILLLFSIFALNAQRTNTVIDSLVSSTLKEHNIPAISASLITPTRVFYGIGGTTKINGTKKVNLSNKFHLGSNTKAITSFIAMKMVEDKKIKLSTKFIDAFPELLSKIKKEYQKITLSDLLSHKAKIQPYTSGLEYKKLPNLKGSVSEKRYDFAKFVLNEEPTKKGTYSNAGYAIASLMLEKKSGKSFEELVNENMANLQLDYFVGFPNKETEDNPAGHINQQPLPPNHSYKLADYMLSAGDISMNIIDYSKFVQLNLNGLKKDNFLSKKSYQKLHFNNEGYSYGWKNSKIKNLTISAHDGSAGTYFCHTILIPKVNIAIVVLTNSADKNQQKGVYQLRELILKNIKRITNEI